MQRILMCFFILLSFSRAYAQNNSTALIPFQSTNGQYGYKNASEQVVIEAQFEEVTVFSNNYAPAKQNNQWGLINTRGKWVIPAAYDSLAWLHSKTPSAELAQEVLAYKQQGKWGLITIRNKIVTPATYDILTPFTLNTVKAGKISTQVASDTLLGIVDMQGKELIPAHYYSLATTSQAGVLLVATTKVYQERPGKALHSFVRAYGLIDWNNKPILPVEFKHIHTTDKGFEAIPFPTWKITGEKGNTLFTHVVDSVYAISATHYAFVSGGKTGIINNDTLLLAGADVIYPLQHGSILFKVDNKYGVFKEISSEMHTFTPSVYDSIVIDSEDFMRAGNFQNNNWEWHVLGSAENQPSVITKEPYNTINNFQDDSLILVQKNNRYGYIDQSGTEVIPPLYDSLGRFTDSVCVAVYNGKYGVLNTQGKWIFEPITSYYAVNQFGHFIRKAKAKYEIVDAAGKIKYSSVTPLTFLPDGSVQIVQKNKVGRLSPAGVLCVPAVYDSVSPLTLANTFWAYSGKNIFLYNITGEMLIKQAGQIEKIIHTKGHDYIPAKIGGRFGFVDGFGRLRMSNRYEDARPFKENLAPVKLSGKWGFLSKQDKIQVQPYYEEVTAFDEDKAIVKKENKYGIIDKQGKVLTAFLYDTIVKHSSGNFVTNIQEKKGMVNKNGHKIVYEKYDQLYPQSNGAAIVQSGNKFGLTDEKGITVIPPGDNLIHKNPFANTYIIKEKAAQFFVDFKDVPMKKAIKNK